MKITQVKGLLTRNMGDMAFIVGNGINLHFNKSAASWDKLLLDLWSNHSYTTKSEVPQGISFPEFYDAIEILNYQDPNFSTVLQKEVKETIQYWMPDRKQNILLEGIRQRQSPLLTTNFDNLIQKSMGLEFFKSRKEKFTDYYPWSCYYSDRSLLSPMNEFGVWYINGMAKYHRSIKLGLSQYMGNVARARKMLLGQDKRTGMFENPNWTGFETWLDIFFHKSLFIFGLSLDENEVFLRWLLIQRAKYFRRHPHLKKKGWFLMKRDGGVESNSGKRFFLDAVGFETLIVDSYQNIYEDLWK